MAFLTGKGLLDAAIPSNRRSNANTRARALVWLNIAAQKLSVARSWQFPVNGPAIEDTTDPLNWPPECQPLFVRAILDSLYEDDFDERHALSLQLGGRELDNLKAWDNRNKPRQRFNNHGYRGSR
jgi:hypothetical protein